MFEITQYIKDTFLSKYQADFSHKPYVCHGYDMIINFCPFYQDTIPIDHLLSRDADKYQYYSPNDSKMALYDFSWIKDGHDMVLVLDVKKEYNLGQREQLECLTIREFLEKHGGKMMVSTSHYRVSWGIFGRW